MTVDSNSTILGIWSFAGTGRNLPFCVLTVTLGHWGHVLGANAVQSRATCKHHNLISSVECIIAANLRFGCSATTSSL